MSILYRWVCQLYLALWQKILLLKFAIAEAKPFHSKSLVMLVK